MTLFILPMTTVIATTAIMNHPLAITTITLAIGIHALQAVVLLPSQVHTHPNITPHTSHTRLHPPRLVTTVGGSHHARSPATINLVQKIALPQNLSAASANGNRLAIAQVIRIPLANGNHAPISVVLRH